jgi:hypothetical protein
MRDIRGDLQDRAGFLEEQISAAEAQFEKRLEQLKREHLAKIEDLQSELEAVTTLIEGEYRRLTSAPVQDDRRPAAPQAEAAPRRQAAPAPEPEHYRRPVQAEVEQPRRQAQEAEPYRRPIQAEAEQPRRQAQEAEPYRQPMPAQAEHQRRPAPEPEPYRRPMPAQAEHQRRPAPEPEPYRRPVQAEAEYQRRPEPMPAPEAEHEHRPPAPQVYRRAPIAAAPETEPRRQAAMAPQQPQQPPLADFLLRKLSEMGALTHDELCQLSVQEGYFAEGEIADRAVHVTLTNVAKAGFIRQLPNGTFAPATVMDTIRLRRAI